jgi:hypothetical protein
MFINHHKGFEAREATGTSNAVALNPIKNERSRSINARSRIFKYQEKALVPFRVTQVFVLHLCHFLNQEDLMEREAMVQHPSSHCRNLTGRQVHTDEIMHHPVGLDHGAGHSLLLLHDTKTSRGQKIKGFNGLGDDLLNASLSLF